MKLSKEFTQFKPDSSINLFVNTLIHQLNNGRPWNRSFLWASKTPLFVYLEKNKEKMKLKDVTLFEKKLKSYRDDLKNVIKNLEKSQQKLMYKNY